jgi:hypothetical protein
VNLREARGRPAAATAIDDPHGCFPKTPIADEFPDTDTRCRRSIIARRWSTIGRLLLLDLRGTQRDAMSEPRNTRDILAEAEHAASSGDFVVAEELLRDAAVRQEAELGPLHPDLANTLNNLAVAAEKRGRLDDAETFYRRAVAIASASLEPDDPKVVASRQNLEDFCHAYGRPAERPRIIEAPAAAPAPPPRTASPPPPPVSSTTSREILHARATLAVVMVGLVIAALFTAWFRSPRHPSTVVTAERSSPPKSADLSASRRSPPSPGAVAPLHRTPTPKVDRAPAAVLAPGTIQLVTVQLCLSFSPGDFQCSPAGDSVLPGAIVLYTRVRSPRDGIIVHQWYRGDTLRKTARLSIGANEAEGYRTYSRQIVDRGDWRVVVRSGTGDLLYEHPLAVR